MARNDAWRAVAERIAARRAGKAGCGEDAGRGMEEPCPCRVIYVTPQGRTFHQELAQELAQEEDLIFLCGHYEGIDERVLEEIVTDEISIGDYVLTGGELPYCNIQIVINREVAISVY